MVDTRPSPLEVASLGLSHGQRGEDRKVNQQNNWFGALQETKWFGCEMYEVAGSVVLTTGRALTGPVGLSAQRSHLGVPTTESWLEMLTGTGGTCTPALPLDNFRLKEKKQM